MVMANIVWEGSLPFNPSLTPSPLLCRYSLSILSLFFLLQVFSQFPGLYHNIHSLHALQYSILHIVYWLCHFHISSSLPPSPIRFFLLVPHFLIPSPISFSSLLSTHPPFIFCPSSPTEVCHCMSDSVLGKARPSPPPPLLLPVVMLSFQYHLSRLYLLWVCYVQCLL